jgi:hypothetical protein
VKKAQMAAGFSTKIEVECRKLEEAVEAVGVAIISQMIFIIP